MVVGQEEEERRSEPYGALSIIVYAYRRYQALSSHRIPFSLGTRLIFPD